MRGPGTAENKNGMDVQRDEDVRVSDRDRLDDFP